MADQWEDAPQGALSLPAKMLVNDAVLQGTNPNWPTGGTQQQLYQESRYNPTAVSPKGALGMAQVEPSTLAAIEKQTGRKLDPNNEDDALFIHRYVMNQNLQHFGDVSKAVQGYNGGWNPSNWNNPETQNYVKEFNDKTKNTSGWEDAPTQAAPIAAAKGGAPASKDGWEDASPSFMDNLKGLGLQAGNLLGMAVEAVPGMASGVAHFGENLVQGQGLSQSLQNAVNQTGQEFKDFGFEGLLNKAGVNTDSLHNTDGYQVAQHLMELPGKGIEAAAPYLAQGIANQTGYDKPITEQDVHDIANLGNAMMIMAPIAHVLGRSEGMVVPDNLEQKLATGNWDDPTAAVPPAEQAPPANTFETEPIPYRQYFEQPSLFDDETQGSAPEGPNFANRTQFGEENPTPDTRGGLSNNRQMDLQLDQGETLRVSPEGEVFPESVADLRDQMSARVTDFNEAIRRGDEFQQGDLFNELDQRHMDQFGNEETPRALSPDEFEQTLKNLAEQEGTRFEMPEDVQEAYSKYLDTVSDKQGGLFDRPTIAKNFADLANREAVADYVNNHPVVKANVQKVAAAEAMLASARDSQTRMGAAGDLQRAKEMLQKSQDNITKFYQGKGDGRFGAYAKDGIIHMNSGIPIPDWIKHGMVRMLRALHGVIVDFADKAMYNLRNIKNTAGILGQGFRQMANEAREKRIDAVRNQKEVDQIKKGPLGVDDRIREWVPDSRPYSEVKPELVAAPDMDSNWLTKNITAQGGIWAAALSKSPVVRWAYTHIQNALKQSETNVARLLTNRQNGLRTLMQKMNTREMGEIHARMDLDEGRVVRSDEELRQMGFNEKQRAYYRRHQEVMKEVFDSLNEGLKRAGMPAVDQRIAYMASRFMGDFRMMIYQKGTKNPVGFIGHNFRPALKAIAAQIEKENPGKYDFEEPTLNKGPQGHTSPNMFMGYLNVLNHFSLNDPEMAAIMDTYRRYFTSSAAKALQALQHTKDKKGIMGAEGRKAWETHEKNAVDGMQSQLHYADHILRWSALQDAASKVKEMMADPDVNAPNAKSYVKDYMAQALGQTTSTWAKGLTSLMDGFAERTGIGSSYLRGLNSFHKSALLQLWLGFFRIPHAALTLTQFMQSNPAMAELIRSRGAGNFWGNTMKGMSTTLNLARKAMIPGTELSGFDKEIWDYQQKNHVFAANLSSHLTNINTSQVGRAFRQIMEANITYPEMAIRSSTFAIWAHTLKEAGVSDPLGTAENLTRASLVDYRPSERPLIFGKMGMMGDIASTLTRFKMNQISQHQYFGKEAVSGKNFTPMVALLASSAAFAGVSGLMGFNVADQLYRWASYLAGKPDTLKAVMLRNLPTWADYGLFAQLGINMQGSFSNADTIPDNPLAAMFPTGNTIANMMQTVGQAAYYHDKTSLKKLAYNFSPTSVKGIEENNWFSQDLPNGEKRYINPNTGKAQSIRTPAEQLWRDLAFHPIEEARDRDVRGAAKEIEEGYGSLREHDVTRLTNKIASGTDTPDDYENFRQSWAAHRGDASAAKQIVEFERNHILTENQRQVPQGALSIGDAHRLQDIFNMGGKIKR